MVTWSFFSDLLIKVCLVNPEWHCHWPLDPLVTSGSQKGCNSVSWLKEHSQSKQRGPWGLLARCLHTVFLPPAPLCTICFCSPFQQSLFYVLSSVVLNDWAKPHQINEGERGELSHWGVAAVPPRLHDILRNWHLNKRLQNILAGCVSRLWV